MGAAMMTKRIYDCLPESKIMEFQLTAGRMKEAARYQSDKFAFVVGDDRYECGRFQACFFSQKVCRILASDAPADTMKVAVDDPRDMFKVVVALMNGEQITITGENAKFLEACARELENDELLSAFIDFKLNREDLTPENVVDRMHIKKEFGIPCDQEIGFAAEHFYELSADVVRTMSLDELEMVLCHGQLKLISEDALLRLLLELASEDVAYSGMLRYVRFPFLSKESLDSFLERVFPDLLDGPIWDSICACLRLLNGSEVGIPSERYHSEAKKEFTPDKGAFSGIISHLRSQCGGNVHQKGVVNITASGNDLNKCHQITDYGWNGAWYSKDEENSWVQFDFKAPIVCVKAYTIKSPQKEYWYCKDWVVEVSDDGKSWVAIDTESNDELRGRLTVKTFQCASPRSGFSRFVRLRQTRVNPVGTFHFNISELELFGTLKA